VSALQLWYNMTLKESSDKPRIYHQLVPMQVEYEYGVTRVSYNLEIFYRTPIIKNFYLLGCNWKT